MPGLFQLAGGPALLRKISLLPNSPGKCRRYGLSQHFKLPSAQNKREQSVMFDAWHVTMSSAVLLRPSPRIPAVLTLSRQAPV